MKAKRMAERMIEAANKPTAEERVAAMVDFMDDTFSFGTAVMAGAVRREVQKQLQAQTAINKRDIV